MQAGLESVQTIWKANLIEMVDGACKMLSEDLEEKQLASIQSLREELQHEQRSCTTSRDLDGIESLPQFRKMISELHQHCQDDMQEQLSDVARTQAFREEQLRGEVERIQGEAQGEAERLWEAISTQLGSNTDRTEALARETQRQCRTWVDGALRKLEDLALRTKERIAALAASSEQREEKLEARLERVLQRCSAVALSSDGVEALSPEPAIAEASPDARVARLSAAAERREARLSACLRQIPCSADAGSPEEGIAKNSPPTPRSG